MNNAKSFQELQERVAACRDCPGMGCAPVLSSANGPADARILFAGEAPGRLGAARTGVPFSGDTAGARFERLLTEAGLTRDDIFVTNAALCLPLDAHGRNRRPSTAEVSACSGWLGETIAVVKPALVVALGVVALAALARIEPHRLILREHVGTVVPWRGARLAVLYHPGARSQVHRPWPRQVDDWQALGAVVQARSGTSCEPGRNLPAKGLTPGNRISTMAS